MQRYTLPEGGLEIDRVITGLWQVADQERLLGAPLDLDAAANHMLEYHDAGFRTFDMADHYGSAEELVGLATAARREEMRERKARLEAGLALSAALRRTDHRPLQRFWPSAQLRLAARLQHHHSEHAPV